MYLLHGFVSGTPPKWPRFPVALPFKPRRQSTKRDFSIVGHTALAKKTRPKKKPTRCQVKVKTLGVHVLVKAAARLGLEEAVASSRGLKGLPSLERT